MNTDCIFNILLFSDLSTTVNCLLINKNTVNLNKQFLWKLLSERDNPDYEDFVTKLNINFYNTYVLCTKLKIIHTEFNLPNKSYYNPYSLYNLKAISKINNNITRIPPEIDILINLEHLNLSQNKLVKLPFEISKINKLTNLTYLNLSRCWLRTLPKEIGSLINLIDLYLRGNDLDELPPELGQLVNLIDLDVSCNNLTSLPIELNNLTKLKEFSLSGNRFNLTDSEIKKFLYKLNYS